MGKNALKTFVDEVNKKTELGTLVDSTPEEWGLLSKATLTITVLQPRLALAPVQPLQTTSSITTH